MSSTTAPPTRRKPSNLTASTTTSTSISTLKKKVRDLRRLLNNPKSTLPANVRVDNERALAAFERELSQAKAAAREKTVAKKYHMVKFFERQKATRKLKKLQREGRSADAKEVYEAELDLNYIMHYPRGEKYISIFKDAGPNCEKRDMIRREIEKRMKSGGLGDATMETEMYMETEEEPTEEEEEGIGKKTKQESKRKGEKKVEGNLPEDDEFFEFSDPHKSTTRGG